MVDDTLEMIDKAEANIRSDFRSGKISTEQFQKEMLIMARARHQEFVRKPDPAPQVTVPIDPTDAMIEAALAADWECDGDEKAAAINVWHAMLAAIEDKT